VEGIYNLRNWKRKKGGMREAGHSIGSRGQGKCRERIGETKWDDLFSRGKGNIQKRKGRQVCLVKQEEQKVVDRSHTGVGILNRRNGSPSRKGGSITEIGIREQSFRERETSG